MSYNSSYLWGNDSAPGGWGGRFFFSFYSELGERRAAALAEVCLLSLTLLASLVANAGIAAAVLRYRELRTVTNCFLLNLAAADVVFALGIPAVAMSRLQRGWQLGDGVCRALPYSQFVCGFVLLWTLTLISMDRHRCIVVPPYRSRLTPRLASLLTAATWLLAAVLFLPVAFWFREQPVEAEGGEQLSVCTLVFPRSDTVNLSLCFTVPVLIVACLLPMGLLVYHYQRIFNKLLASRSRWAVPCVASSGGGGGGVNVAPDCDSSGTPTATNNNNNNNNNSAQALRRDSDLSFVGSLMMPWARKVSGASQASGGGVGGHQARAGSLSQHEELRLSKHLRVVRVLLLNVLVVLLMWLPITIMMFLIYVDGSRPNEDTAFFLRSHHFVWSLLVALLNTVVNPLLYGVLSENFRACFARMWLGGRGRRRRQRELMRGCGGGGGGGGGCGGSKSNAADAFGGIANRTPSSGRANGYVTASGAKFAKKMSGCSIGSVLELPSGQMV
ncbi:neuropeptide FF receptor 2-like [Schistocerca americana]|uniref:neuropeptide FF receptor 2-like n=1 Tax=Schistocerca americana TaxID=7009 RepID=UPI001F500875|nr:neuropeptide FF receptor 2-like [Schistocerca americana]